MEKPILAITMGDPASIGPGGISIQRTALNRQAHGTTCVIVVDLQQDTAAVAFRSVAGNGGAGDAQCPYTGIDTTATIICSRICIVC